MNQTFVFGTLAILYSFYISRRIESQYVKMAVLAIYVCLVYTYFSSITIEFKRDENNKIDHIAEYFVWGLIIGISAVALSIFSERNAIVTSVLNVGDFLGINLRPYAETIVILLIYYLGFILMDIIKKIFNIQ